MNYEELLDISFASNLIVKELLLNANKGRIKGNRIAIRKDIPTLKEKACVLAEELGHFYTSCGDILDQSKIENRKQEIKARSWAYDKQIGLIGIIRAFEAGCKNLFETAEYLEVTEEFIQDAINYYRQKYGVYKSIEKYIIYFEPNLGVMKLL